ncbi:hypothetical protein BH20BAC1_BH20BAC1_01950 [soil metagenome]
MVCVNNYPQNQFDDSPIPRFKITTNKTLLIAGFKLNSIENDKQEKGQILTG